MKLFKNSVYALLLALSVMACSSKNETNFSAFTKQYFDDKNALFPLEAMGNSPEASGEPSRLAA